LFPLDRIAVIGTDEQLKRFKDYIENPSVAKTAGLEKKEIALKQLTVNPGSWLLNKSVRESGIREKAKGIIVGIERNGQRILNPESNTVFQEGDIIWIVGSVRRLNVLLNNNRLRQAGKAQQT
jgi:CPA2 family monovalent cation:H+ antiporter-2